MLPLVLYATVEPPGSADCAVVHPSSPAALDEKHVYAKRKACAEDHACIDEIGVLDHGSFVAEGSPAELKRLVTGGHIRLAFADAAELERAARILDGGTRDDEALSLQIPSDGGVRSLRALLDRLDASSIDVSALSVETPDLDDVFLSLTGDPDKEKATAR